MREQKLSLKFWPCLRWVVSILSVTAVSVAHGLSPDEIRRAWAADSGGDSESPELQLGSLPEFVRNARCDDLTVATRGQVKGLRLSLQIRYRAPRAWQAFVTAHRSQQVTVLSLCHAVLRGHILREEDLCDDERKPGVSAQALTARIQATGRMVRRPLTAGSLLYPHQLAMPELIARGDPVSIEAVRGAARIVARGTSRQSGALGDRIDVRNERSGRTLSVWVIGRGRTSTQPHSTQMEDISAARAKVSLGSAVMQGRMPGNPGM